MNVRVHVGVAILAPYEMGNYQISALEWRLFY